MNPEIACLKNIAMNLREALRARIVEILLTDDRKRIEDLVFALDRANIDIDVSGEYNTIRKIELGAFYYEPTVKP